MNKILRSISVFILITFTLGCLAPQSPIFAASTGTLKIFSETKGVSVYIDEELKGIDVMEIRDLEPGDHYVRITKGDTILYSELVKVSGGVTAAVLIKTKAPTVTQVNDAFYKQGQQYKQEKLDIMLSKNVQTVGSATTSYNNFPGYFSYFDYSTTNLSSTQYETTDWKIVKGEVQQISDNEFATLVGDKVTLDIMSADWDDYNNLMGWGAMIGLVGIVMVLAGGAMAFGSDNTTESGKASIDSGAVLFAVGCLPTIIGLGIISKNPPSGHYVQPGTAAKQAFDYNQALKKKLGLPESYEPK